MSHKCECGETHPDKFIPKYKSVCRACYAVVRRAKLVEQRQSEPMERKLAIVQGFVDYFKNKDVR